MRFQLRTPRSRVAGPSDWAGQELSGAHRGGCRCDRTQFVLCSLAAVVLGRGSRVRPVDLQSAAHSSVLALRGGLLVDLLALACASVDILTRDTCTNVSARPGRYESGLATLQDEQFSRYPRSC